MYVPCYGDFTLSTHTHTHTHTHSHAQEIVRDRIKGALFGLLIAGVCVCVCMCVHIY
jgi:hypothetical protein